MSEPLYVVEVETPSEQKRLLQITGSRETVVETCLRVILDCAPLWDDRTMTDPLFRVRVRKVT